MDSPTLIVSPVTFAGEVEAMRVIFNGCLEYMTKPFDPITPEQQAEWWADLPSKTIRFKAFVYRDPESMQIVAYSLLQWRPNGWVTVVWGIAPHARGHNYARQVIRHFIGAAEGPLHAEELASNTPVVKLHREAGFVVYREENGIHYIYHPGTG